MTRRRDYIASFLILSLILGISFVQNSYGATSKNQLEMYLPAVSATAVNELTVWQTVDIKLERRKDAEVIYLAEEGNTLTQLYIDRANSSMTILGVGRAPLVESLDDEGMKWSMKEEQYLESRGLVFRKADVVLDRRGRTCILKYDVQKSAGIHSIINLQGELRVPCLKTMISH
ncbi:hypothetical protein [Pseudobacteriovorax antillogorgiicola]|uniref:Uncharacterized protein n=1 Tax=Pseudobacteriovorax antillogorgiicola TaxID=1513793 RepID=A0A1Y6C338_9BACT|nr:hypothetical protein [Pseudobacteriovorax antillogorgiicola]TCS50343.1 hypothetical protein EDD56_113162 [Pseudobacteriovorax antillogorgiicola]SMF34773.1 hypothetical protein SAMN06296036_110161 [Pseudobacteriovorax antillogorgiicola]